MQTQENPWTQFDWHEVMKDMQTLGESIREEVLTKKKPSASPPINIEVLENHYLLYVFLVGYAKENLKLSWENHSMTIKALPTDADVQASYVVQEYVLMPLDRTFDLPTDTEPERMEAKFEHGILRIKLPKTLPAQNEVSII